MRKCKFGVKAAKNAKRELQRQKYEEEACWHFKFAWFPKKIKIVDKDIVCWLWLKWYQRKTVDDFWCWVEFPSIRRYGYKLGDLAED